MILIGLAGFTLLLFFPILSETTDKGENEKVKEQIELTFLRNLGNPSFNRATKK